MDRTGDTVKLRIFDGNRIKAQIQWEPRDIWIGLFWRTTERERNRYLHLYVCVVPFLPMHVTVWLGVRR